MFLVSYRFYPKDGTEAYFDGPLSSFLAALSQNGQLIGEWNLVERDGCIEYIGQIPEETALDSCHHDGFATAAYDILLENSEREPTQQILGPALDESSPCTCASPGSYILFTTLIQVAPPVLCGDCGGHVPLYRLPRLGGEGNWYRVLGWEATYKACDQLYMGSGIGERFGIRQTRNPRSELSAEGRGICRELAAKVGAPVYYFLNSGMRSFGKRCPDCGSDWDAERNVANRFNLVCDRCSLVSMR